MSRDLENLDKLIADVHTEIEHHTAMVARATANYKNAVELARQYQIDAWVKRQMSDKIEELTSQVENLQAQVEHLQQVGAEKDQQHEKDAAEIARLQREVFLARMNGVDSESD